MLLKNVKPRAGLSTPNSFLWVSVRIVSHMYKNLKKPVKVKNI